MGQKIFQAPSAPEPWPTLGGEGGGPAQKPVTHSEKTTQSPPPPRGEGRTGVKKRYGAQLFGRSLQKSAGALLFGARAYTGPALLFWGGLSLYGVSPRRGDYATGGLSKLCVNYAILCDIM